MLNDCVEHIGSGIAQTKIPVVSVQNWVRSAVATSVLKSIT